jgi:hypothetical protein
MGINSILSTWGCFGRNPVLATRVLIDTVGAPLLPSNPVRYVLELEKSGYLEDTQTLAVGTALLYSIAFSAAYALMSMTYGILWI